MEEEGANNSDVVPFFNPGSVGHLMVEESTLSASAAPTAASAMEFSGDHTEPVFW